MPAILIDSSALLAVINQEPGKDKVEPWLGQVVISAVNFAETLGKMILNGVPAEQAQAALRSLVEQIISFDEDIAVTAGALITHTKPYGLSLADRACLATAMQLDLAVLTADKVWTKIKNGPKIVLIR